MKKITQLSVLLIGCLCLASSAFGAAKWWDINGTTGGSGQGTGTGTWAGIATAIWNTDSTGGAGGALSTWTLNASADSAYFSAGTDATSAFIVTVGANSTVGGVVFEEGTVHVKSQTAGGGNIMSLNPTASSTTIFYVDSDAQGIWETGSANIGITVRKQGSGTLTVNTANGWGNTTAGTALIIDEGTLATPALTYTIGNHHTLGRMPQITLGAASTAGTLLYTGGAATFGTHATLHTAINISAAGGEIRNTGGGQLTIGAAAGTVGIIKGAAGGDVTWSGGSFRLNTVATYDGDTIIASGATLISGQANVLPFGAGKGNVTVNGILNPVAGSVDCSINGLNGSGTVTGGHASSNFQLGNGNAHGSFSGNIGVGGIHVRVRKLGTGTQTLTGVNSTTGTWTNDAGALVLSGSGSLSAVTNMTFLGSTTFDVAGVSSPPYSIGGSQRINFPSAGSTVTLNGSLTLDSGARVEMGYSSGTPAANVPAGTLTLTDNDIVVQTSSELAAGTYTLISKSGSGAVAGSVGGTLSVTGAGTGGDTNYLTITSGQLILHVEAAAGPQSLHWASGNGTWEIGGSTPWHDSDHNSVSYSESTPPGDAVLFDDTDSGSSPITVTLDTTVQPTSFAVTSAKNWTITGSGGVSGSIGLTKGGSGTLTLATSNGYSGTTAVSDGTLVLGHASDTIDGAVTISGGATLDVDNPDTVGVVTLTSGTISGDSTLTGSSYAVASGTISATLSGSGTLTKTTASTVTISGDNSGYTGSIVINDGAIAVGHGSALGGTGTGTSVSGAAAVLRVSGGLTVAEPVTLNNVISGGQLRSVSDANEWSGTVTLGASSTIGVDAGSLELSAATALAMGSGNALFVEGAGSLEISGVITGSGGTNNLSGSGTVTLSGNNSYTGATAVRSGTVVVNRLANAGASSSFGAPPNDDNAIIILGESAATTVQWVGGASDNATARGLRIAGGPGNNVTFDASGTGPVSFNSGSLGMNTGAKTLFFTGSNTGDNLFHPDIPDVGSGDITVTKNGTGKWVLDGDSIFVGQLNVNDGTLAIGAGSTEGSVTTTVISVNGDNNARLIFNRSSSYTLTAAQNISNSGSGNNAVLEQAGSGTLVIAGTLTGGHPWEVSNGTLQIGSGSGGSLSGAVSITNNAAVAFSRTDAALTFSGVIRGSGTVEKANTGTVTFSAANAYTGGTTVSAGKLALTGAGAIASSATITVNSGATLDVSGVTSPPYAIASGQTLNGDGNIVGALTVDGTLAPGTSIGTLTSDSSVTLAGDTDMEIDKAAGPTLTSDKLVLTGGTLTFGGDLNVTASGDALSGGEQFDLFDAPAFTGSFASTNLPSLPPADPALNWYTDNLGTDGTILVNRAPVAATAPYVRGKGTTLKIKIDGVDSLLATHTSDADGNARTLSSVGSPTAPTQGSVSISGGYIQYEPTDLNDTTSDTFSYAISDGRGGVATGVINVTVENSIGAIAVTGYDQTNITLRFYGIPGYNYVVQRGSNVYFTNFIDELVTNPAAANGLFEYTDGTPPYSPAFYRVRSE